MEKTIIIVAVVAIVYLIYFLLALYHNKVKYNAYKRNLNAMKAIKKRITEAIKHEEKVNENSK